MQTKLWSYDFGACVFLRELLKSGFRGDFELFLQQKKCSVLEKDVIKEADLWLDAMKLVIKEQSKFGRVGVFIERKNQEAFDFFSAFDVSICGYVPKKSRSEKIPKINIFPTQLLVEMANEGMGDSIEFRRLFRKYIRKAKNYHCDTIFFADTILGAENTKKIIQSIAGTQIKCCFVSDYFLEFLISRKLVLSKEGSCNISIHTQDDVIFTEKRSESLLKTKLKKDTVVK